MIGIHLIGAGNHSRDILWTIKDCNTAGQQHYHVLAHWVDRDYVDDKSRNINELVTQIQVTPLRTDEMLFLAMMDVSARNRLAGLFHPGTARYAKLIHPTAVIENLASLGDGVLVQAGAIVSPNVKIGKHVIVNLQAMLGHGVEIGAFSVVGPGVKLLGSSLIGSNVIIGAGAIVMNEIEVGDGAFIAAGAFVTQSVKPGAFVVGNPAKAVEIPMWMRDGRFL